jgi:formylglycine-generating enzyme required for sulfatase activity
MKSNRLSVSLIVASMFVACTSPIGTTSDSTTGSISGKAVLSGQSNNAGITITVDSVSSKGLTPSVEGSLSGKGAGGKAIAASATTDASGAYSLTGIAPGSYTIYASIANSLERAVSIVVTVTAGMDITVADLILTPTGSITGTATLNGATSGNLGIVVYIAGTSYSAMTDDSGAFTISSVPVGTGYTLVASKEGYNSQQATVSVSASGATKAGTLDLSTYVAPSTTGSVTGTTQLNGVASPGVFVYLAGSSNIAVSGEKGAFTISGVAHGTYTLIASMNGYITQTVGLVSVSAGASSPAGTINLNYPIPVTGVTASPTSLRFPISGPSKVITATVAPANATDSSLTWSTSDASVAAISASTATVTVTPGAVGSAMITATTADGHKTATCVVTVVGNEISPTIGNMIIVLGGTFQRDGTATNLSTVSSFHMSQNLITRAQYLAVMGVDPSQTDWSSGMSDPVQNVSWYRAIAFCNKLSIAEGRTQAYSVSGVDFGALTFASIPSSSDTNWNGATIDAEATGYRLPYEAEYLWAAMGGSSDARSGDIVDGVNSGGHSKAYAGSLEAGGGVANIGSYCWYSGNTNLISTKPVGTLLGNELGLKDMTGNVMEWCNDWSGTIPSGSQTDYTGASSGYNRVVRCCAFNQGTAGLDLVPGGWGQYPGAYFDTGFRVVTHL